MRDYLDVYILDCPSRNCGSAERVMSFLPAGAEMKLVERSFGGIRTG